MKFVTFHNDEPRAGTLLIAIGFEREHKLILRLINRHRERFESFGPLIKRKVSRSEASNYGLSKSLIAPEKSSAGRLKKRSPDVFNDLKIKAVTYTDAKGERRKEYVLNRDAFLWFAMSFTGKRADRFRADFIKAFNAMEFWIKERIANSIEYRLMSETLQEVRKLQGKSTEKHHYSNEARLINWAMTGRFSAIDRTNLSADDLDLLLALQQRNSVLIGAGMSYRDRKESLRIFCELRKQEAA